MFLHGLCRAQAQPEKSPTIHISRADDAHLHVVLLRQDEPAAVRANVARREDIDSDERKWSGDFRLTSVVNPFTASYVGYIDKFENVDIVLRRIDRAGTSVGRQVPGKVSYLLRF